LKLLIHTIINAIQTIFLVSLAVAILPILARAGDRPYFVTYDHHLEEPGSLEISLNSTLGFPSKANRFAGGWMEFEYGIRGWWTTEVYLNGQTTQHDSTIFTGYRWENRFRPLMREHWINPVLYVEYENVNGADKTLREVVGTDSEIDKAESNHELRMEHEREIETKLILSSNLKGWNVSENLIAVKNLGNAPWEFGYSVGTSRPLSLVASAASCSLCLENFHAGIEIYGGLGDRHSFGLANTSHYIAPGVSWSLPSGMVLRVSPSFGLTDTSYPFLLRFGVSYEYSGLGPRIRSLFRK
jgi:hypothetical protein